MSNQKFRVFNALLYPDDESQSEAIRLLKSSSYFSCGILHDKDEKEDGDGELKKPHYHIVFKFQNPRSKKAVADELHITENYIEPSHHINDSLLYLLHRNAPEKYQYTVDECFGTLKPQLEKLLDDDTEDIKALKILDLLDSIETRITVSVFYRLCAEKGLWSDLRRGSYLFVQAIKEHNERYPFTLSDFTELENKVSAYNYDSKK